MAKTARMAAVQMLDAVLGEGRLLAQCEGILAGLEPAERARAQRLATSVLRQLVPSDLVLKPFLRKEPPLPVLNLLRLGVVELAAGEAAHGVVNEAVNAVRASRNHAPLSGLVNAVLRKVAAIPAPFEAMAAQPMPPWLRRRLMNVYGKAAVQAMEVVQARPAPIDLTLHAGDNRMIEGAVRLPTGSLRLPAGIQVSALDGYAEGRFWVQDAAAALAARLLGPVAGQRVLDLCAAPGGKTLQLASAGADVTALDINDARLERLRDNLMRTGLSATIECADALEWQPDAPFDAILLDAPCSATGTIRRHPDLPFVKDASDIKALVELQGQILDRALAWLKPGGRLVYCTCSLLPEEGEKQVAAALARHPALKVVPPTIDGIAPDWITEEGGLRLRPDFWAAEGGMDGFFMVCLTQ